MLQQETEPSSSDAMNFLTNTIITIVKAIANDLDIKSDLIENSETLNSYARENVNKALFTQNISQFMTNYEKACCEMQSNDRTNLIKKIIHSAYKIEKEKLRSIYSLIKNTYISRGYDDSLQSPHITNLSTCCDSSDQSNFLGRKLGKPFELSGSDSETSKNRSETQSQVSSIEFISHSRKNLLKLIKFENNTIGSLIVNTNLGGVNNGYKDNSRLQRSSTLTFAAAALNLNEDKPIKIQFNEQPSKIQAYKLPKDCRFKFDPISIENYSKLSDAERCTK